MVFPQFYFVLMHLYLIKKKSFLSPPTKYQNRITSQSNCFWTVHDSFFFSFFLRIRNIVFLETQIDNSKKKMQLQFDSRIYCFQIFFLAFLFIVKKTDINNCLGATANTKTNKKKKKNHCNDKRFFFF